MVDGRASATGGTFGRGPTLLRLPPRDSSASAPPATDLARPYRAHIEPDQPVYALNLFDVADADEYRAYARASPAQVARHGGRVVAMGRHRERVSGDLEPRRVLILVEWESPAAFRGYREDPELADLHAHRERGTENYVWMLFDRLEDLRPVLRGET